MNLDKDFYLVKFTLDQSYTKVLGDGPWFIERNFHSIHSWEPKFSADITECKQTAIWARLPKLPPKIYDSNTLRKIGNKLGTILKIDAHKNDALCGQYAQIYVQVSNC